MRKCFPFFFLSVSPPLVDGSSVMNGTAAFVIRENLPTKMKVARKKNFQYVKRTTNSVRPLASVRSPLSYSMIISLLQGVSNSLFFLLQTNLIIYKGETFERFIFTRKISVQEIVSHGNYLR